MRGVPIYSCTLPVTTLVRTDVKESGRRFVKNEIESNESNHKKDCIYYNSRSKLVVQVVCLLVYYLCNIHSI